MSGASFAATPPPVAPATGNAIDPVLQVLLALAPTLSALIALAALGFAIVNNIVQRRRDNAVGPNSVLMQLAEDGKSIVVYNDGPMPIIDVTVHVNRRRAGSELDRPAIRAGGDLAFGAPSGVNVKANFTKREVTFVIFRDGRGQFWTKAATGLAKRVKAPLTSE